MQDYCTQARSAAYGRLVGLLRENSNTDPYELLELVIQRANYKAARAQMMRRMHYCECSLLILPLSGYGDGHRSVMRALCSHIQHINALIEEADLRMAFVLHAHYDKTPLRLNLFLREITCYEQCLLLHE